MNTHENLPNAGKTTLAFDDITDVCDYLDDLIRAQGGAAPKKRRIPISKQSELPGEWVDHSIVPKKGKRLLAFRDPENPSLEVTPIKGKGKGYFFHYWFDDTMYAFPLEVCDEWTLSDAQQVAKTADAIRVLESGEDHERMPWAIEHLEILLEDCERVHRILEAGVDMAFGIDKDIDDELEGIRQGYIAIGRV